MNYVMLVPNDYGDLVYRAAPEGTRGVGIQYNGPDHILELVIVGSDLRLRSVWDDLGLYPWSPNSIQIKPQVSQ